MKTRGDILLISCYELGHQPFHLASLAATLQQAGYQPSLVDTAIESASDDAIRQARFIAIAVPMHTALRMGEQLAHRIRRVNPEAYICLYGLYAHLNAEHLLRETIDAAIGGEYEVPLLKLVQSLEREEQPVIDGVSTRTHSSHPWIARTPFLQPDRQQLPALERYARLEWNDEQRVTGYTEATRGCKHTCQHCPITPVYQGRFFAVPLQLVMADIRAQVAQGAQHITFGDPDFWNGPTHALRLARTLHQEFPEVTFDATIKIEHILKHRDLLPEMRELGCLFVVSAVESLNDTVLERLDKGHTSADIQEAFELTEEAGINLRPSLLPFTPWETLDSYVQLLDFFEDQHLIEQIDPVHLSIRLLIPPGSALLNDQERSQWLDDLDAASYTYRWHHPDPRMDRLQQQIAQLVEQDDACQADKIETFFSIKALAKAAQQQFFSKKLAIRSYGQRKVLPHLTETWFC
jgi:radical SAM superfamily enzyme YgiQ (UPF0313 family)